MLNDILLIVFIYIISIIVHELSHAVMLKYYGIKPTIKYESLKIMIGPREELKKLSDHKYTMSAFAGVFGGAVVIYLYAVFLDSFMILALFIPYIIGSWTDIKIIMEYKNESIL
jgi:hypothetical protein